MNMKNNRIMPWYLVVLFFVSFISSRGFAMEHLVKNNNVTLWAESFGDKNNPPLLLVMGGGSQGIMWPKPFCDQLAKNFFVIRYDHRDVGLSSRIDYEKHPYDLKDMADDALAILDYFNITEAYVFGTSMGGVITQILASYYPDRIIKAFIMSSTSDLSGLIDAIEGNTTKPKLPGPSDEYLSWIKGLVNNPAQTENEKIAQHLSGWRLLNGKVLSFEEDLYKNLIIDQCRRQGGSEEGVGNHILAIKSWLQKKQPLAHIKMPLYVFWGDQDLIFSAEHPKRILKSADQGHFFLVKGMGHNLNIAIYDFIISIIKTATFAN